MFEFFFEHLKLAGNLAPSSLALTNLSSRARVDVGDNVLISGFVVEGTTPKRLLIRAAGPALASAGVTSPLATPVLDLYQGEALLNTNAGWGNAEGDIAGLSASLNAAPFAAGSHDAALLVNLAPGAYTTHVHGGSGVALVELFEATMDGEDARLINVSTRGRVDSGENVMIGGFVIGGTEPRNVLVRGIGPALAAYDVAGFLVNPTLTVYRNQNVVATNDNWSDAPNAAAIAAAAAATGAFALPSGSADAAILMSFDPGEYTAVVTSADASTGIALVETYGVHDGEQGSWNEDDELMVTEDGVAYVRTPDSRFQDLPDWPYEYRYVEIDGLRQAYAEAGPSDGPVVLLLHGQPTWSYLYRKMIPVLAQAGYRVIAMDHLGMGRSDKPINIDDYSYLGHNDRLEKFIQALALRDINLFVQDWGSLIGLRVAGMNPAWFASIAVGNGALPVWPAGTEVYPVVENPDEILDIPAPYALIPDQQPRFYIGCQRLVPASPDGFAQWMEFAMKSIQFVPSGTVEAQTWFPISAAVEAAYDAPFPSRLYMAGTRKFPSLVNEVPGTTDEAWVGLSNFTRPFVTIWASNDIGEMGACEAAQIFIDRVPGAAGQPHVRLPESSHFLQDDQGEEIARRLVEFYLQNGID